MTLHRRALLPLLAAALTGCSLVPTQPPQAVYDLGPAQAAPGATSASGPALAVQMVPAPVLESTALLYRLNWRDATQLQTYRDSRWAATPGALLAERLRQQAAGRTIAAGKAATPVLLRVELSEFAQHFASAERSQGVLRLRASLIDAAQGRVLRQRSFATEHDAATPDAAGGVHALAAAADDAIAQMLAWAAESSR
jgi:cholesterol transport system auxiliary component